MVVHISERTQVSARTTWLGWLIASDAASADNTSSLSVGAPAKLATAAREGAAPLARLMASPPAPTWERAGVAGARSSAAACAAKRFAKSLPARECSLAAAFATNRAHQDICDPCRRFGESFACWVWTSITGHGLVGRRRTTR